MPGSSKAAPATGDLDEAGDEVGLACDDVAVALRAEDETALFHAFEAVLKFLLTTGFEAELVDQLRDV
jgi:hypothetical protein